MTIPSSVNVYCGACQLNDRASCLRLNGYCWKDSKNLSETPKINETNCLLNMAPVCYKIWSANGFKTDDSQCKQYQQKYNATLMSKKASIINATQVYSSSAIITILFDTDTNSKTAHNCASLLAIDTVRALGYSASCRWKTSREYEISYNPIQEYVTSISFKGGNIYINYLYTMESMDAITISVPSPELNFTFGLNIPKIIPPFSPAQLKIKTTPGKPVIWSYAWMISYVSGNLTNSQVVEANDFFKTLQTFDPNRQTITIPANVIYPNSVLKVLINAKHQYSSSIYVDEAFLNITGEASGSDLSSKSAITSSLYGKKKNNFEVSVLPTNLFRSGTGSIEGSQLNLSAAPTNSTFTFEVRSGDNPNSINTRGADEIAIEKMLNSKFKSLKLLSLSTSSYFKYYTYYNVTLKILSWNTTQESSGVDPFFELISSSSLVLYLTKQTPVCKIITPGFLIDPSKDSTFSSKESILDTTEGDEILYFWDCVSCLSLLSNTSCSCDIFSSLSQRQGYNATISGGVLNSASRYVISVSIFVKTGEISNSCYTTAEVVTMIGAKNGVGAIQVQGYGGVKNLENGSRVSISDLYFELNIDKSDYAKNVAKIKWDLIEVVDKLTGKTIGSIKNSYLKQLLKSEYNIDVKARRMLQTSDQAIPSDYTPTEITASANYPPIFGIDQSNLKSNLRYTYAAKISYSGDASKSAITTVSVDTGTDLLQRDFSVYPYIGYAYSTLFTFSFDTASGVQQEETIYTLYRSDCWNGPSIWQTNSDYTRISTNLKNINSFATILSPGLQACSYQVKIKLIVTLGGKSQELFATVTVMPMSASMREQKVSILGTLASNFSQVSFIQSLSILSQISQNNDKTNDNFIIQQVINFITSYDTVQFNDIFNALDADEFSGFMQILIEILKAIISSDYQIITRDVADIIINKLQMYCRIASTTMTNGENIISSLLSAFSAILTLRDYNVNIFTSNNDQNIIVGKSEINQIVSSIYQLAEIKLKGVIPGGHTYSILTPNIGLSLNSVNFVIANASNSNLTIANQNNSFVLIPSPYNLSLSGSIQQADSSYVLTTVLLTIAATPMNDIKISTVIDTKSLRQNSLANGKITAETLNLIYDDLRTTGKLSSSVNFQQVNNQNLFFGVYLSKYEMSTGQTKIVTNASLSNIINEVAFGVTLSQSTSNDKDTPRVPLYYLFSNGTWTNQGCFLDDQAANFTRASNIPIAPLIIDGSPQQIVIIRCNFSNLNLMGSNSSSIVQIAVDSFKDFKKLVMNNGYPSSFEDGKEFTKLKSAVYIILFGGIGFFVLIAALLGINDKIQFNNACIDALFNHFQKREEPACSKSGLMGRLSKFLLELKNRSFYYIIFGSSAAATSGPEGSSDRKIETEKDPKPIRRESEESPGIKSKTVREFIID